jgi:hypothetical protein
MISKWNNAFTNHSYLRIGFVILILLSLVKLNFAQTVFDEEGWELAKDKDGIKIYTRQMKGMKLKEFKAFTSMYTTVENIIHVLLDIDNYDQWTVNVKNSRLLSIVSEDETYVYSVANTPWPFANRDIINHIHVYWSPTRDTATLVIDGVPDYLPEKKGIIRMPVSKGEWHIYQMTEEKVNIEYSYAVDPAGAIPAWVVNMFIVDGPYKTLLMMKDYIESTNK